MNPNKLISELIDQLLSKQNIIAGLHIHIERLKTKVKELEETNESLANKIAELEVKQRLDEFLHSV